MILLLTNYQLGLSFMLFFIRIILELISSLKELSRLRIFHFLAHIGAFFSLMNIYYLIQRRKLNKKIRTISDIELFEKEIIYDKSIVYKYYLLKKLFFKDIFN